MINLALIIFGKLLSLFFRLLNLGNGSTWPGHIALKLNPDFIKQMLTGSKIKIILIAGTNGKTTTAKLLGSLLTAGGSRVLQNNSGANLLNGIASSLLLAASMTGKLPYEYAIFEIDENALPLLLDEVEPDILILLNLFRDQLDRYGEVHIIAKQWKKALMRLSSKTQLLLNADDPEIAFLGRETKAVVHYFGLKDSAVTSDHAADSVHCPNCHARLNYRKIYYSHLGDWQCDSCKLTRPQHETSEFSHFPLAGIYNRYNTLASVLTARIFKIAEEQIITACREFTPAFGRQEILEKDGRRIQVFLSKNPTSFNQSLRTIHELRGKNVLILLNDGIADGRDVSWIWDTSLEQYLSNIECLTISGTRCYDFGLRVKYAQEFQISNLKFQIVEDLEKAVIIALEKTPKDKTLYILPTYTAMLEARKVLTGKKIL